MFKKYILLAILMCTSVFSQASPQSIHLQTPQGELFDMDNMKGKVYVVLYVDPDKKALAQSTIKVIDQGGFLNVSRIFVVNLQATWKPASLIRSMLSKQSFDPRIHYLLDEKGAGVHLWGLSSDGVSIAVVDRQGRVRFRKKAPLQKQERLKLLKTLQVLLQEGD